MPNNITRCPWGDVPDALMRDYHDNEWCNMERDASSRGNQCAYIYDGRTLIAEPEILLDGTAVIQAFEPLTGEKIGASYKTGSMAVPIACDINGDGLMDIVYAAGKQLCAVSFDGENWSELWSKGFRSNLAWSVYGDINSNGKGELVVTAGGVLYVVG